MGKLRRREARELATVTWRSRPGFQPRALRRPQVLLVKKALECLWGCTLAPQLLSTVGYGRLPLLLHLYR